MTNIIRQFIYINVDIKNEVFIYLFIYTVFYLKF